MKKLKIVIVAQNCYPRQGPRSHRTTELAKELARLGYDVTVYALLGDFDYTKYEKETAIHFKSLGVSKWGLDDNTYWYSKNIIYRIIGKFFGKTLEFPLIEHIPLVKRALKSEGEIDYLITIAHPHTIHWGAASFVAKNKKRIKFWVADCGDPYMKNPFNWHPSYLSYFEKKWGRLCDFITVPIKEAKTAYYQEFVNKIRVIPQGFSFKNIHLATYKPNTIPTFAYSGTIYASKRDPGEFLNYLISLNINFKFVIFTNSDIFYRPYKEKLGDKLELRSYIPRDSLLYELSKMDFLINIKNISGVQQPSKLIDYAMAQRPILEISTEFNEKEEFKQFIRKDYASKLIMTNIEDYDIENVTKQFLNLFYSKQFNNK